MTFMRFHRTAAALARVSELGRSVMDILSRAPGFDANAPTVSSGVIAFFRLSPADRTAALAVLAKAPDDLTTSVSEIDKALAGFNSLPDSSDLGSVIASLRPAVAQLQDLRDKLAVPLELKMTAAEVEEKKKNWQPWAYKPGE